MLTPIFITQLLFFFGVTSNVANQAYYNQLIGTHWRSDGVAFHIADRESYTLTSQEDTDNMIQWGNFIDFTKDTFSTYYSAPCGNDCFTSVNGSYKYIGKNLIQIEVKDIQYNGWCSEDFKKGTPFTATYTVTILENTATLQKMG